MTKCPQPCAQQRQTISRLVLPAGVASGGLLTNKNKTTKKLILAGNQGTDLFGVELRAVAIDRETIQASGLEPILRPTLGGGGRVVDRWYFRPFYWV